MNSKLHFLSWSLLLSAQFSCFASGISLPAKQQQVLRIQGKKFVQGPGVGLEVHIHGGEMHYFRVPPIYWDDRLRRLRAMGLNFVSTYVPWNFHEESEGVFDFSTLGKDVVRFVQLAQSHGLQVILRPGPYICAEWDFGGLPAWLIPYAYEQGMRLRTYDKKFLSYVDRFWSRLFTLVRPELQEHGGAIAMVQLENEFGAYGDANRLEDGMYLEHLKQTARAHLGPHILLMTTDDAKKSAKGLGTIPGVLSAVNLGPWRNPKTHLDEAFGMVEEVNKGMPELVMELWTGWFQQWEWDEWSVSRFHEPGKHLVSYVAEILRRNASFVLYMAHGGTNPGHWGSASALSMGPSHEDDKEKQHPLTKIKTKIDAFRGVVHSSFLTTSYDYAAPISEEGRHGSGGDGLDKFTALRDLLTKHRKEFAPLEPPFQKLMSYAGNGPQGTIPLQRLRALRDPGTLASLCVGHWRKEASSEPQPMEFYGQQNGLVLYRFTPGNEHRPGLHGKLTLKAKDRISVWHGDEMLENLTLSTEHELGAVVLGHSVWQVGFSHHRSLTVDLSERSMDTVDVLVENLGRRAYSDRFKYGEVQSIWDDWKGLSEAYVDGYLLKGNWSVCALPLNNISNLKGFAGTQPGLSDTIRGPTFFHGVVTIHHDPSDTFLRLDGGAWNTGSAFINGRNIGRYNRHSSGPFDFYVPKSMLHAGVNRITLLEMDPPSSDENLFVGLADSRAVHGKRFQNH
eukprot:TRINITY_DN11850_c0_g1_i1.p1 TRINITY_DN11850_c0_g1~~TRINITY_DN11850_c0_g1_i1.p1  ORF type:complete len:734 (-),score=100.90 TRINITY_DN11850_c0_g1_i1:84-2285(-)